MIIIKIVKGIHGAERDDCGENSQEENFFLKKKKLKNLI